MDSLLQTLPMQEQEGTGGNRGEDKAPGVGQGLDLVAYTGHCRVSGTQTAKQGCATSWERNPLKLTKRGDGALQLLCRY